MSAFEIVQAVPADAQEIGTLRAHNWKEQYAHLNGVTTEWIDSEVERIAGETGNRSRTSSIEQATRPGANCYWIVARIGGALVGFLEARRHDDGLQELHSLHLVPGQRGLGIGQALMDVAGDGWFDSNVETVLDVAEVNKTGQRFYLRPPNSYKFTGYTFSYGPITMLQMTRKL